MDTNIDNYTVTELLIILDLDTIDHDQIIEKTNDYIEQFAEEDNPDMENFFIDMQTKLLQYSEDFDTSVEPV
jgi:hypothetical protein